MIEIEPRDPRAIPITRRATVYGTLVPRSKCLEAIPRTRDIPTKRTASTGLYSSFEEFEDFSSISLYEIAASITVAITSHEEGDVYKKPSSLQLNKLIHYYLSTPVYIYIGS